MYYSCYQVDSLNDRKDFDNVRNAMKILGCSIAEIDSIWKLLASILHLVSIVGYLHMCSFVYARARVPGTLVLFHYPRLCGRRV